MTFSHEFSFFFFLDWDTALSPVYKVRSFGAGVTSDMEL